MLGVLAAVLRYTLFRGRNFGWVIAVLIVAMLAAVPTIRDQWRKSADLAAFAPDEVRPDRLTLEEGGLLQLQLNAAGLTCGYHCPDLTQAGFVTEVKESDLVWVQDGRYGEEMGVLDLWRALDAPDRSQPFPYRHALIISWFYQLPGASAFESYRFPHWPESAHGVVSLVSIPPDGILDMTKAAPHYRRFNIQDDWSQYPFLTFANDTDHSPHVEDMVREIISLQPR